MRVNLCKQELSVESMGGGVAPPDLIRPTTRKRSPGDLHHLHHWQRLAIFERHRDPLHLHVPFQSVKRHARQRRSHLKPVESRCPGSILNRRQDERPKPLTRKLRAHKNSSHLRRIRRRIQQGIVSPSRGPHRQVFVLGVVATGPKIGAEQGLPFGPSPAPSDFLSYFAVCPNRFGNKVGPVADQLRIQSQHRSQRAFNLRRRIVSCLQSAHRGLNQRMQRRNIFLRRKTQSKCSFHFSILLDFSDYTCISKPLYWLVTIFAARSYDPRL